MADRTVERRRKQDWVVRSVSIISALGWLFAIVSLLLAGQAQPRGEDFFTRIFHTQVASYLDVGMLEVAFISLLVSFVACAVGFVANMARHRRKSDRFNKSVIILGIVSFLGIIAFLLTYV